MGDLWKTNWKIAAGKSPTLADEAGEVLVFGQEVAGVISSGDFVAGQGMKIDASGIAPDAILVFQATGAGASGVAGPGTSTDRAIATWNGAAGDELRNTGILINASNLLTVPGGITNSGGIINKVTLFPTSPAFIATIDFFCILNAAGVASITLPAAPSTGQTHVIKDGAGDAGSSIKTVFPSAGTIEGLGSVIMPSNSAALNFIYDGTEWKVY